MLGLPVQAENAYSAKLEKDIEFVKQLNAKAANGDRSLCPGLSTPYMTFCLIDFIGRAEIATDPMVSGLMLASSSAMKLDRKKNYPNTIILILYTDAILLVLEKIDLAKFYSATFEPKNEQEEKSLHLLLPSEEQALEAFADMVKTIKGPTDEIQQNMTQGRLKMPPWETAKIRDLQTRFSRIEGKSWVSIGVLKMLKRDLNRPIKEAQSAFCQLKAANKQHQSEESQCQSRVRNSYETCLLKFSKNLNGVFKDADSQNAFRASVRKCAEEGNLWVKAKNTSIHRPSNGRETLGMEHPRTLLMVATTKL